MVTMAATKAATKAKAKMKGRNWGGPRPGSGRPRGSKTGGPSQRFTAHVSGDYRTWIAAFAGSLGTTELELFREAMKGLAEARGYPPPPPR
jgi:hypothetical protein